MLRAAVTAVTLAVALTGPAAPAAAAPSASFLRIQNVSVSYDPADPYAPVVTYRLRCALPKDSPLRTGTTVDSRVLLRQGDSWWHSHGPYEVPRDYACDTWVSFTLSTDSPDGFAALTGPAQVSIRETVLVDGTPVTEAYDGTAVVRPAR